MSEPRSTYAFTLVELVTLVALVAFAATLFAPALAHTKSNNHAARCLNNLRQLSAACRMYADDNSDTLPNTNAVMSAYKGLVKTYVGLQAPSSSNDWLFACPADR